MKNGELVMRGRKSLWHPCTQMKSLENSPPIAVSRAEGIWLYDFEGRRYLDALSSWWVNLFGHCHPKINSAICEQMKTLEHVMLAGCTHQPAVELSERLSALSPGNLGHAFYGSDGASAVEIALKMSFHYWKNSGVPGKIDFVSLEGGYHGETVGALSVTDIPIFSRTYSELLRKNFRVKSPDARLAEAGESAQDYAARAAAELETLFERHHDHIAAFIVEPLVQGAAGMGMHHPDYLREAKRLCEKYRVHFIADEIAVGFGRTGTMFACEQAGISPDFLCLSKGITGGYLPLSAVLCTDEIFDAFYSLETGRGFLHSHSYTGNPLACRAALATLDIFQEENTLAANREKTLHGNRQAAALKNHPAVLNFRSIGMIWAFEAETSRPDFAQRFHLAARERELLLRPIGNTVYFMPPYAIRPEEIDFLFDGALAALREAL